MLWKYVLGTMLVLLALGAASRIRVALRRRRQLTQILEGDVVRHARSVSVRALVYGTVPVLGLKPRRPNRCRGDMVLTRDRFLLSTRRGPLADIGEGRGRRFTSVRCTGPGRLIMEGRLPQARGDAGVFRFELHLPDAVDWAHALQPFVEADPEGPTYGVAIPDVESGPS